MLELLSLPFFQRVLLAGLLASFACGVIGTWVVAMRMATLSGGLAHASFGGVGLGYWLGFPPMLGATGFALLTGLAIGLAYRRLESRIDVLISMTWAVGMALGILFIALAPGYAPDLTSYLFGSLLFVPWSYVWLVLALDAVIALVVWRFFEQLQAVAFDEAFAELVGLRVEALFLTLLALTALAIVTLIRVVGIILAIALFTVPAAIARQWATDLRHMMLIATGVCAGATVAGLLGSWALSTEFGIAAPPGPLIILGTALLYAASTAARRPRRSGVA